MKGTCWILVLTVLWAPSTFARQLKELDSDVIYDESRIPHYNLPPLLVDTVEPFQRLQRGRAIRIVVEHPTEGPNRLIAVIELGF